MKSSRLFSLSKQIRLFLFVAAANVLCSTLRAGSTSQQAQVPTSATTTVTFSPSPIVTGWAKDGSKDIEVSVTGTVTPAGAAGSISIVAAGAGTAELKIGPVTSDTTKGTVIFNVGGAAATPANKPAGDVTVQAMFGGGSVGFANAIVVVPTTVSQADGTPSIVDSSAADGQGGTDLTSTASETITLTIKDQFGANLDKCYNGNSLVKEKFTVDPASLNPELFPSGATGQYGVISVPDAVLAGGVKKDLCFYSLKVGIGQPPLTAQQATQWANFQLNLAGNGTNTTLSQLKGAMQAKAIDNIQCCGWDLTPSYTREIKVQNAGSPPVPYSVTDTPKN